MAYAILGRTTTCTAIVTDYQTCKSALHQIHDDTNLFKIGTPHCGRLNNTTGFFYKIPVALDVNCVYFRVLVKRSMNT